MSDDLYKSLNTTRLYEQVVEQLENLIVEGRLKQGERLPSERELSERFQVSRTVIREAVKSLQEKGLLDVRSGVGTFVHNGTQEILRQSLGRLVLIDQLHGLTNLMQLREILEPEIAALAAENATPHNIQAMELAIEQMNQSFGNPEAFISADHEFHLALAQATQNDLIVNLIDSIVDSLSAQRMQIIQAGVDGPQRGQFHHVRILQAVKRGNRDLSRRQMIAHLLQIREDSVDRDESD